PRAHANFGAGVEGARAIERAAAHVRGVGPARQGELAAVGRVYQADLRTGCAGPEREREVDATADRHQEVDRLEARRAELDHAWRADLPGAADHAARAHMRQKAACRERVVLEQLRRVALVAELDRVAARPRQRLGVEPRFDAGTAREQGDLPAA